MKTKKSRTKRRFKIEVTECEGVWVVGNVRLCSIQSPGSVVVYDYREGLPSPRTLEGRDAELVEELLEALIERLGAAR